MEVEVEVVGTAGVEVVAVKATDDRLALVVLYSRILARSSLASVITAKMAQHIAASSDHATTRTRFGVGRQPSIFKV